MAHIKKMPDKPRSLPFAPKSAVKATQRWSRTSRPRHKRSLGQRARKEPSRKGAASHDQATGETNRRRYRSTVFPRNHSNERNRVSEPTVLKAFLRKTICKKSFAYIKRQDAHAYINERLAEKKKGKLIHPRTVRHELNSIQPIFEIAKDRWEGLENLVNPFRGIQIKGSSVRRNRRLEQGELRRLMKHAPNVVVSIAATSL